MRVEQGRCARFTGKVAAANQGANGPAESGVNCTGGAAGFRNAFKQIDNDTVGLDLGDVALLNADIHHKFILFIQNGLVAENKFV